MIGRAKTGTLPNLVVIGAAKCGTGALHYYLDLHPEIQMSKPKELHFFESEDDFHPEPFIAEPEEWRLFSQTMNWSRGTRWYESRFRSDASIRGEATPAYTSPWHPGIPARMAGLLPDARLIFLVRDPVERIVSQYIQLRVEGREWRTLSEAVRRPTSVYVARTRYASLLRPFLEHYPRSRILILRQEDLLLRRRETMAGVFGFLGVDERVWSSKMERERHISQRMGPRWRGLQLLQKSRFAVPAYRLPQEVKWMIERLSRASPVERPTVGADLRQRLLEELEPEIVSLEKLTGWNLSRWRGAAPASAAA